MTSTSEANIGGHLHDVTRKDNINVGTLPLLNQRHAVGQRDSTSHGMIPKLDDIIKENRLMAKLRGGLWRWVQAREIE